MDDGEVLCRELGAIRELTLSNPARRNALNRQVLIGLKEGIGAAAYDRRRCIVLRGDGDKVFSSGYDLTQLPTSTGDALPDQELVSSLDFIEHCLVPIVVLLNGHAFGGGLELAARCDLRIAVEGSLFGMPPAKLGIIYAPRGLARFFALLGPGATRRLFLTGAPISASEALRIGLVDEVYPTLAEAEERAFALAAEIAANAPMAIEGTRRILRDLEYSLLSKLDRAEIEDERRMAFESDDAREGLAAFLEKRPPVFTGR